MIARNNVIPAAPERARFVGPRNCKVHHHEATRSAVRKCHDDFTSGLVHTCVYFFVFVETNNAESPVRCVQSRSDCPLTLTLQPLGALGHTNTSALLPGRHWFSITNIISPWRFRGIMPRTGQPEIRPARRRPIVRSLYRKLIDRKHFFLFI